MALRDMWTPALPAVLLTQGPCQDLGASGRQRGMAGKGERQGLLGCFLTVRAWASDFLSQT